MYTLSDAAPDGVGNHQGGRQDESSESATQLSVLSSRRRSAAENGETVGRTDDHSRRARIAPEPRMAGGMVVLVFQLSNVPRHLHVARDTLRITPVATCVITDSIIKLTSRNHGAGGSALAVELIVHRRC